jgi:hypothetical protein
MTSCGEEGREAQGPSLAEVEVDEGLDDEQVRLRLASVGGEVPVLREETAEDERSRVLDEDEAGMIVRAISFPSLETENGMTGCTLRL